MIKKLNLGTASAPKASKPVHPVIKVDDETQTLLTQFAQINPQYKTLKNQRDTLTASLAPRIKAAFFALYNGVAPQSSTMLIQLPTGTLKLVTKDAYTSKVADEAAIVEAIGAENTAKYFRQATVIKLELTKLPDDRQEDFASAVIALAEKMDCSAAVSATQCIQPRAGFHEARTALFSLEQNLALDSAIPFTAYAM